MAQPFLSSYGKIVYAFLQSYLTNILKQKPDHALIREQCRNATEKGLIFHGEDTEVRANRPHHAPTAAPEADEQARPTPSSNVRGGGGG